PGASAVASCFALGLGHTAGRQRSALIADAVSFGCALLLVFGLALVPLGRDVFGLLVIAAVAIRFAPAAWLLRRAPAWPALLALSFCVYAALAGWHQIASLPLGDQVHYLLATDRLAHGRVDATIDPVLFRRLTTLHPT